MRGLSIPSLMDFRPSSPVKLKVHKVDTRCHTDFLIHILELTLDSVWDVLTMIIHFDFFMRGMEKYS